MTESTLDTPPMEERRLVVEFKGYGGNKRTCRISFGIHKNRIGIEDALALFNQTQINVHLTTENYEQPELNGTEDVVISVDGIASTNGLNFTGDKRSGSLSFEKNDDLVAILAQLSGKDGTLIVRGVQSIVKKVKGESKVHPDLQTSSDRPVTGPELPGMSALADRIAETELGTLTHPDNPDKPILSKKAAQSLAMAKLTTLGEFMSYLETHGSDARRKLVAETKSFTAPAYDRLFEAFTHASQAAKSEDSGGMRICQNCSSVRIGGDTCNDCEEKHAFYDAVTDSTVNEHGEWPLGECQTELLTEVGDVTATRLLKEDEFGLWHPGSLVSVTIDGEVQESGVQPSLGGAKLDRAMAELAAIELVLEDIDSLRGEFESANLAKAAEDVQKMVPETAPTK